MFTISNPYSSPFLHSPYPKLAVKQMPPSGHANDQVENCNGQTPSSCEQPIQSLSANFFPFSNWMKINHIPPSLALKTHGIWWMNDNFQFLARQKKISSVNESGGGKTERERVARVWSGEGRKTNGPEILPRRPKCWQGRKGRGGEGRRAESVITTW